MTVPEMNTLNRIMSVMTNEVFGEIGTVEAKRLMFKRGTKREVVGTPFQRRTTASGGQVPTATEHAEKDAANMKL